MWDCELHLFALIASPELTPPSNDVVTRYTKHKSFLCSSISGINGSDLGDDQVDYKLPPAQNGGRLKRSPTNCQSGQAAMIFISSKLLCLLPQLTLIITLLPPSQDDASSTARFGSATSLETGTLSSIHAATVMY